MVVITTDINNDTSESILNILELFVNKLSHQYNTESLFKNRIMMNGWYKVGIEIGSKAVILRKLDMYTK